jgi:hypothetical protein
MQGLYLGRSGVGSLQWAELYVVSEGQYMKIATASQ